MSAVLQQSGLNAVVAGGGGIGLAVARRLLADYPVRKLFLLQRRQTCELEDSRLQMLHVDALAPETLENAVQQIRQHCEELHLVFNGVGMLHGEGFRPEKRLKDVTPEALVQLATVNAFFLPALANALAPLLRHSRPSILASLSARVGSISDNGMGGWYSYRASKAAHNMLLKTLSREWRISHKNCSVIALHPGTVSTALSEPYTPANYKKRVLTPDECAQSLLSILDTVSVDQSGAFYGWDGAEIPW